MLRAMRIALATCRDLPEWEKDDAPLHAAFVKLGADIACVAWDDPKASWREFDACLLRTTWDYAPRLPEFLAWIDRVSQETRLFNPAPTVRWNTSKTYLADLESRGAPVIPTVWLAAGESIDVARVLAERGWTGGFLKPQVGATSRETLRFSSDPGRLEAAQAHADRVLGSESLMLQPYLPSVETEGELSVMFVDGRVTHAVRKVPRAGDYRVQDDFGASDHPVAPSPEEVQLATRVMGLAGPDLLYGRVDFLRDGSGTLRVNEVELVEPSFFFRHGAEAAPALATSLIQRLERHEAHRRPHSG